MTEPLSHEVTLSPSERRDVIFMPCGKHVSAFWLETLGPCDGLLLTSIEIDREEQLAVDHAPAAMLETLEAIDHIVLPSVTPHSRVVVRFVNHADVPAHFRIWFGSQAQLRLKWAEALEKRYATPEGDHS